MTTSNIHPAAAKRDAAHRRVQRVTLGVAAAVVGATSFGAVALAQSAAATGSASSSTSSQTRTTGGHLTSGAGHAPVTSSGGS